jgi:hypothetical protein
MASTVAMTGARIAETTAKTAETTAVIVAFRQH